MIKEINMKKLPKYKENLRIIDNKIKQYDKRNKHGEIT